MNFYVENEVLSEITISKSFNSFLRNFSPDKIADAIVEVFIDDDYVEISLPSLLTGVLRKKDHISDDKDSDLNFRNFMVFKISESNKNPLPNDEALSISFDSILESPGSTEKDRLKSCIKMVNRIKKDSEDYFYTPFLNVCQSSGSGKTKIATELMFEMPSFYIVLREEVFNVESARRTQSGYPFMSSISKLFLNIPANLFDDTKLTESHTSASVVGRYLLLLKALLGDYLNALETLLKTENNSLESVLKVLYKKIMDGTFMGNDLEIFENNLKWTSTYINIKTYEFQKIKDSNSRPLTMKIVTEACQKLLEKIDSIRKKALSENIHDQPFLLIVDEASFLTTDAKKTGVNLFRLFRRAVNRLGRGTNFVVVTLGTNSDVLDLNPDLTFDSFRESLAGKIFPPFLLSRNWDLFMDYKEFKKYSIGYKEMLNGRMILFWFSLGRPLWSSISFSRLIGFIRIKICNNSLKTGEAYLAFWMVRVGLLVNPTHVITQYLVKSLMATILHVSPDFKSMRVYYPSEPALAVGIRPILMMKNSIENYYAALEMFIKARAIDTGRFAEIISGDICLLAISNAQEKRKECKWNYNEETMPKVCGANSFIFEKSKFHTDESLDKINQLNYQTTDENISNLFAQHYIVLEANEFIRSLYSLESSEKEEKTGIIERQKMSIMSKIERFLPKLMKTAHLNMTHYTQISTKFPFELFKTVYGIDLQMTVPPVADSRYARGQQLCNQITAEVLESMIIRGSGIMLAPNTFGLDHVIPVCFEPADTNNQSRPEYSFIGVQVKRGSVSNIRTIVAKGAVSNHYVRCGLHGGSGRCTTYECKFRIPDHNFKRILENGMMLVHSLTDDVIDFGEADGNGSNKYIDELLTEIKHVKIDSEDYIISCETSLSGAAEFFQELQQLKKQKIEKKITNDDYNERKNVVETNLKDLIKDLCPTEYLEKIDKFKFDEFKISHYETCRFIPDIYLEVRISKELSIHCMVKKRSDGIIEKLVAIYSKGINAFSNVLPEIARMTARRIIFEDRSIFDEIPHDSSVVNEQPSIKYAELITSIVSRNNGSYIPIANNFIRSKYEKPLIPDYVPDYTNVDKDNLEDIL